MSVTEEELMAFADGELSGADAARVEAAIAADPALAKRIEAERKLRAALRGHLDPVAQEPVPDAWKAMIAAAAREDADDDHKVISLAAARAEKAEKAAREARAAPRPRSFTQRWGTGMVIAASLVLGLFIGLRTTAEGPVAERDGALIASGSLAKGLDTRLASAQGGGVQILTSFRREDGNYCRVFASGETSGIACKDNAAWVIERTIKGSAAQSSEYRQAGSAWTELMGVAQNMAKGAPLDAEEEQAAKARDWRN